MKSDTRIKTPTVILIGITFIIAGLLTNMLGAIEHSLGTCIMGAFLVCEGMGTVMVGLL